MRKRQFRKLQYKYQRRFYKPQGIPKRDLEIVNITKEELETLRLRYLKGKTQTEASKQMGLSQSQYQRDLWEVNKKITDAIINGKALQIDL